MNDKPDPEKAAPTASEAEWPAFPTPPKEVVFAVGVVAVSYNALESLFFALFALVTGIPSHLQSALFQRLANNERVDLVRAALGGNKWPEETIVLFEHFLAGYDICAANRNVLMHSIAGIGEEPTPLTKFTKRGSMEVLPTSLDNIRRAADDIASFSTYGVTLAGRLMTNRMDDGRFDPAARLPWPEKPPLPHKLRYTRN